MKYTRQERLVIGKEICEGVFSVQEAAVRYGIDFYTARGYLRAYKALKNAPLKEEELKSAKAQQPGSPPKPEAMHGERDMSSYREYLRSLSREELEDELVRMKEREGKIRGLFD